jgi:beta-N-acetylglucosaminidase
MTQIKKVFKYGTGDVIPEGAVYLSTQVETVERADQGGIKFIHNQFVWHYFLVEVEEEQND